MKMFSESKRAMKLDTLYYSRNILLVLITERLHLKFLSSSGQRVTAIKSLKSILTNSNVNKYFNFERKHYFMIQEPF